MGAGLFGYFPTYTLGNLISAQLAQRMEREIGLSGLIRAGEFLKIRDWLNRNFHRLGCSGNMSELVKQTTGEELSIRPFIEYLRRKFA